MAVFTESFEGLVPSANVGLVPPYYYMNLATPHTFGSGVELLEPIGGLAVVGDFLQGNADFGTTLTAGDVPTGSAYLALDTASGHLTLKFSTKVYSVGAYVNTKSGEGPGVAAYDKNGNLLSGAEIRSVPFADWDSNYVTLLSRKPIVSIEIFGGYVTVDDLMFDTARPKIVKGTSGNDKLTPETSNKAEYVNCKNGNDKVNAKGGDDTIDTGKGKDKVHAGDGNDCIIVGKGAAKVSGDAGQDSFVIVGLVADVKLKDFNVFDDTIILSKAVFAGLGAGPLAPSQFQLGTAADDPHDRIIYDASTGNVFFDSDGNGLALPTQFGSLSAGLAMTNADFLIP